MCKERRDSRPTYNKKGQLYFAEVDAGERAYRGRQLPDQTRELAGQANARAVVVQHHDLVRLC